MKVSELIEKLNNIDKDLEVYTDCYDGDWFPLNTIMIYGDKVIVHFLAQEVQDCLAEEVE